jgi:protein-disulfide isomerase
VKLTRLLTAGVLVTAAVSPVVMADNASVPGPDQTKAIEQIVHDYLVNNPEVLLEASQALQQKQQQTMQREAKSAILQNANDLLNETFAVAGNPKGDVTLIEFFDYQCIHCKKMKPVVNDLIKKDANLRVIYKEFPIFGKSSETASKVALAAAMQGKYAQLQEALLKIDKHLDDALVMQAAKDAGLNMTKLKTDMDSKAVSDALTANRQLAEKMHLMGTPAFVVLATPGGIFKADSNPAFIPGATSGEALQGLIDQAAGKK